MRQILRASAVAALVLGAAQMASAQTAVLDFEDGTDQGFGTGFGNDGSATFNIVTINGSKWMAVPKGGFQSAGRETSNPADPLFIAMTAAAANEALYQFSYDWLVDTSTFSTLPSIPTFLQIGSYMNSGSGFYGQNFGAIKEVELNGAQLASGQVFSGHVVVNFTTYGDIPPSVGNPVPETFFRPGLIINTDGGLAPIVNFDNITVGPIPEPATLGLVALGLPALALRRRRA